MKITSSAFGHNQKIPSKYTCNGDNISPPLSFSEVPQNTISLVLIMDDPDAPNGYWVHWVLFNIPPDTVELAENSSPLNAVKGTTSFGRTGYGGPCPPAGEHRYFFKLFALDTSLNLDQKVTKEGMESAMKGHVISQAELVGLYSKKN